MVSANCEWHRAYEVWHHSEAWCLRRDGTTSAGRVTALTRSTGGHARAQAPVQNLFLFTWIEREQELNAPLAQVSEALAKWGISMSGGRTVGPGGVHVIAAALPQA
jgi:hypothetical protein